MNNLSPLKPAFAAFFLLASLAHAQVPSYTNHPFKLPSDTQDLTAADFNGDGRVDLLAQRENELRLYLQSPSGFDFVAGFVRLAARSGSMGWDIAQSADGIAQLVVLEGAGGASSQVSTVALKTEQDGTPQWDTPRVLLSGLRSALGAGVHRLKFARDINADGEMDLIIPDADRLALYLATGEGFVEPLLVQTESRLNTTLYSSSLRRDIGQALDIPPLNLRDVNADGAQDLIVDTESSLSVFLANSGAASTFPSEASYTIDREEIEARLGEFDIENLDFANLTGVLALTHEELLEDIDGDGIEDLLLREGGKVSVFAGNASGLDLAAPRQVLRSGGNVLSTFLYDEDEDGKKDLWLWRVEPISVGDIFVWLALSGSISIEAFVYRSDGVTFARRPARKVSVALKFPSVIRLASSLSDIADQARAAGENPTSLSLSTGLDDANNNDLLLLAEGQLRAYLNILETAAPPSFLGTLGYTRERDDYEIDLKAVIDQALIARDPLAGITTAPVFQLPVDADPRSGGLVSIDLNGDTRKDIFVFTAMTPDAIEGILLLSN
jgi:hypothetical protein